MQKQVEVCFGLTKKAPQAFGFGIFSGDAKFRKKLRPEIGRSKFHEKNRSVEIQRSKLQKRKVRSKTMMRNLVLDYRVRSRKCA